MSKRALFLLPVMALLSMACGLASMIPGAKDVQDALTQAAPALSTASALGTAAPSVDLPAAGLPVFEQDADKVVSLVENGDARTLYDQINESDAGEMFAPATQHYTVDLKSTDKIDLSTGWCAKTKDIMDANEKRITGSISVDGHVIPNDQLVAFSSSTAAGTSQDYPDGLSCYSWDIVASQWPVGTHTVVESWTLASALNDGYADYEAGTYAIEYAVTVTE